MPGQLFTHYFLTDGIKATPEWRAQALAFAAFRESAGRAFEGFEKRNRPNEAETEQDLIRPILERLGWADYLPQQGAARNEDIPDHLLFADAASKDRAAASPAAERYRYAAVVEESKRYGLPSTPATRTIRSKRPLPTARFCATFRLPMMRPMGESGGAS